MTLAGKTLLITGGTGSFGRAITSRLLGTDIRAIRIFSRNEGIQHDMRLHYQAQYPPLAHKLQFIIGDVRDAQAVLHAAAGADYIFHAAGLKQVPACEVYPLEAVKTNILGTENVLAAAACAGAEKVICLSTDKAVAPASVMGMTKGLMEKIMMARAASAAAAGTVFCATRYGNVMCSRGSVIPLFVSQILSGQPITVTAPEMTRFMMTLEDASLLVLQALRHGKQGDILVPKAAACSVLTLAQALLQVFDADNPIQTIGIRPGEKQHETLISAHEMASAEDCGAFFRISTLKNAAEGMHHIHYTSDSVQQLDVDALAEILLGVPYIQSALAGKRA